jgi:hypothetical protein
MYCTVPLHQQVPSPYAENVTFTKLAPPPKAVGRGRELKGGVEGKLKNIDFSVLPSRACNVVRRAAVVGRLSSIILMSNKCFLASPPLLPSALFPFQRL